jgi:hypothetical protein
MSHESGHVIIEAFSAPLNKSGKLKVWHTLVGIALAAFSGGAFFF